MAIHKIAAAVALVAGGTQAWQVRGVLLVTPSGAAIIAEGVHIVWHLWPALLAAAAAALAIAGTWSARVAEDEVRAVLAAEIEATEKERQRLNEERRGVEAARVAGEAEIKRVKRTLDTDHQTLIMLLDRQRLQIGRLQGELVGARQHIQRLKKAPKG